jgi:hypothetical protein
MIAAILFIFPFLSTYALLSYAKISLAKRLLIISIVQVIIFGLLMAFNAFEGFDSPMPVLIIFAFTVAPLLLINILLLPLIWVFKKIRRRASG